MVKKTSFLEKLKNRWRPASGIRVDETPGAKAGTETNRLHSVAKPQVEQVSSRKLSAKQEAVVAINEGFKELASLLRGMQTRIDDQGEQVHSAVDSLGQLPALNQAQIELMRTMAERLEKQNDVTSELAAHLGDMPEIVDKLRESVDKAAATDVRTAQTLDEFKSNMSEIQSAMSKIVDHSGQHVEATSSLADGQQRALEGLTTTTEKSVQSLRKSQTEQAERLSKLVESNKRTNKWIAWLLAATVITLIVIAGMLAG